MDAEIERLEAKIAAAERLTSAQIRLAIAGSSWLGIERKAVGIFRKHRLERTSGRNAVLLLFVPKNHEFLVYGDVGVHEKTGQDFWDDVRDAMAGRFRAGRFYEGLALGVELVGAKLALIFPPKACRTDEITNAVIFER